MPDSCQNRKILATAVLMGISGAATACVLHGLSLRAASDQLGLSHYTVRRHCQIIDALVEASRSWKHR